MTILQLVSARQFRGAEVAAAAFSRVMIARGHKVIFVGIRKPSHPPLEVPGAVCRDLKGGGSSFLLAAWRLLSIVNHEQPDVLHANGSITLKYLVFVSCFYRRARLGYRNISMVSHWKGKGIKHAVVRWLIHRADFVTSVGEAARQDFIKTYGYPAEQIFVVRRGISLPENTTTRNEARQRLQIPPSARVLLNVGNFSPEKGHQVLVERFAKLHQLEPDTRLILVGEGALKTAIQNQVLSLNLHAVVSFPGLQSKLTDFYLASDLLLLTSLVEGVPGVVLEAAAHHLPTVASNVGGVGESILDGTTGLLTDPDDASGFVESVRSLLNNADKRQQLGQAAFEWVRDEFNLEKNGGRLITIFEHRENL